MVKETITPGKNGLANIFRQQAIDALNTIDQNEVALSIIDPYSWLWMLICLLLLIAIVSWIVFGQITLTVDSLGIIVSAKQIDEAELAIEQTIKYKKDKFDELADLYNKKLILYKKHYLTRMDLMQAKEAYIAANTDFLEYSQKLLVPMLQEKTTSPTVALVFVNYLQGKKIFPGMYGNVRPLISTHNRIAGRVIGVSENSVSRQFAYFYLQNMELVDRYFTEGAPFIIKFQTDADLVLPGSPVVVSITYKSCTPLQLLIKSKYCA